METSSFAYLYRLLGVLIGGVAFGVPVACAGETFQLIKSPTPIADGEAKIEFPPGSHWSEFEIQDLLSYEGGVKDGAADGEGIVRFPDQPSYGAVGAVPQQNFYIGKFKAGRPVGEGTYVTSSFGFTQSITGIYAGNEVTMSLDGQLIAVITRLPDQSKTVVRLMQYPGFSRTQPSRMFFGEFGLSGITGEWVDVPWYADDGKRTIAGYGRYVSNEFADGGSSSCVYPARAGDAPGLLEALTSQGGNSPVADQRSASLDRIYLRGTAECTVQNEKGWTWRFRANFDGISPATISYIDCHTPDGKRGDLRNGGRRCRTHKGHKQDVITNVGREFKRFVDRRIIGSIDRAGGAFESSLCRATGTEPGVNCNVSIEVGASWPVGDGSAPQLPADEQAVRSSYVAATKRARALTDHVAPGALNDDIGMAADLNAMCSALCNSEGQRRYSLHLLAELEQVALQPVTDETYRAVSGVNRETASVLAAGLRAVVITGTVAAAAIPFYRFVRSTRQNDRIQMAFDAVNAQPRQTNFEYLKARNSAIASLTALQTAHLNRMASEGTQVIGAAIRANIRILRGFPPQKISTLVVAITLGRTAKQVHDFIEKYKDVQTEEELYDALIREAVTPIGIKWPPTGR